MGQRRYIGIVGRKDCVTKTKKRYIAKVNAPVEYKKKVFGGDNVVYKQTSLDAFFGKLNKQTQVA